jgi:hypothetical protein
MTLRFLIKLVTILSLCIGFANATGSGIPHESLVSPNSTETAEMLTSLVDQSHLTAAIIRPSVDTTFRPAIQKELTELNVPESIIDSAIAAQEEKLTKNPLIINDSVDATQEFHGFFVSNDTTSPAPDTIQEGFIQHGSEGITRAFSSEGMQLFFVVDSETEKFQSPSGVEKPVSYSIAIPNGTIIVIKNNITYATYNGKILLTILHDNLSSLSSIGSDLPAQTGLSWVEYAESNTPSTFGSFSSLWNIPHSPQLSGETNILFNGIESSDPSLTYIIQPVTAFNFKSNCNNVTDCVWQNVWTGSAWCVYGQNNSDFHTYPPVYFSELDPAWGYVIWDNPNSCYIIYITNERTNDWQGIGIIGLSLNPQYQQAVVTYEAWPKIIFPNNRKIYSTTFTQMWAGDMQNNPISLNWISTVNTQGHPLFSGLHVDLSQAPSTVILETNHPDGIGVFRPSTHLFYLKNGSVTTIVNWGLSTDLPVTGDWNGDGLHDVGIYRPSTHTFFLKNGSVTTSINWGLDTDLPVTGMW